MYYLKKLLQNKIIPYIQKILSLSNKKFILIMNKTEGIYNIKKAEKKTENQENIKVL